MFNDCVGNKTMGEQTRKSPRQTGGTQEGKVCVRMRVMMAVPTCLEGWDHYDKRPSMAFTGDRLARWGPRC